MKLEGKAQKLQCELTSILEGAQRVPTLLTLNPTQTLTSLNLGNYEVLDCEPLHDITGHLNNILPEITHLLLPPLKTEFQQTLKTTLPKGKVSGAFIRVAAIKVLLKLRQHQIDPLLVMLLETVVRISAILYSQDSRRIQKGSSGYTTVSGYTINFAVIFFFALNFKLDHTCLEPIFIP